MNNRKQRVKAEATALWLELSDEAPPVSADGGEMLDILLHRLPPASYDRLNSPHLRSPSLSWPKRR